MTRLESFCYGVAAVNILAGGAAVLNNPRHIDIVCRATDYLATCSADERAAFVRAANVERAATWCSSLADGAPGVFADGATDGGYWPIVAYAVIKGRAPASAYTSGASATRLRATLLQLAQDGDERAAIWLADHTELF